MISVRPGTPVHGNSPDAVEKHDSIRSRERFDKRTEAAFLLQVTMRTQTHLDLGRVAYKVERSEAFAALGCRVIGDLLHDRVPRILISEAADGGA